MHSLGKEKQKSTTTYSIKYSFFHTCNELITMNPFSQQVFLLILIIEGLLQLFLPLLMIFDAPLLVSIDNLSTPTAIKIFNGLFLLATATILTIIQLFLWLWYSTYQSVKHCLIMKRQAIDNSSPDMQKSCQFKLLTILSVIYLHCISLIAYYVFFIAIQQYYKPNQVLKLSAFDLFLKSSSIILLVLGFGVAVVIDRFLTVPYPITPIPWAKGPSNFSLIYLLQPVLNAFTFTSQQASSTIKILVIINFLYSILVLVASILTIRYYRPMTNKLVLAKSCFIALAQLLATFQIFSSLQESNKSIYFSSYLLTSIILILSTIVIKQKVAAREITNTNFRNLDEAIKSVERTILKISLKRDAGYLEIKNKRIVVQSLFYNHSEKCFWIDCLCKQEETLNQFRQQKVLLKSGDQQIPSIQSLYQRMQITLVSILINQIENQFQKRSEYIEFFKIHFSAVADHNFFPNYFSLSQIHSCNTKNCTFYNCFLAYQLKILLIKSIKRQEEFTRQQFNFERNIVYEELFSDYLVSIKSCNESIQAYWKYLDSPDPSIVSMLTIGSNVSTQYMKFKECYDNIFSQIGSSIVTECLAFKLHKGIMNFEGESDDNVNIIRNLEQKERYVLKQQGEDQFQFSKIEGNFGLVMMSLHPNSFQKLETVNKQFSMMSGYSTDELQGNANVFMPQKIGEAHHFILKEFSADLAKQGKITNLVTWLKQKNGYIVPITIKVQPSIHLTKGYNLIGIVVVPKMLEVSKQKIPLSSVFIILTDKYDKLLDFTLNCSTILSFNLDMIRQDFTIFQIFPELEAFSDEQLSHGVDVTMDLSKLAMCHESIQSSPQTKIDLKKRDFSSRVIKVNIKRSVGFNKTKIQDSYYISEYQFVITHDSNISLQDAFISQNLRNTTVSMDQISPLQSVQVFESQDSNFGVLIFQSELGELENPGSYTSVSSTTASNSSIKEMKGVLDIHKMPRSIEKFRVAMFIIFLVLISTSAALLIINLVSKNNFSRSVEMTQNIKNVRNREEAIKTHVLYIFALQNAKVVNRSSIASVQTPFKDPLDFFVDRLNDSINLYQISLNSLFLSFHTYSSGIQELFDGTTLQFQDIDTNGIISNLNFTFKNGLQHYLMQAETVRTMPFTPSNRTIFGQDMTDLVKFGNLDQYQKSVYFILQNSVSTMKSVLDTLDKSAIDQVKVSINKIVLGVLIVTIVCCGIVFIVSSLILPFLFKIDKDQISMLDMNFQIRKDVKLRMIKKINKFDSYISRNKFFTSQIDLSIDFNEDKVVNKNTHVQARILELEEEIKEEVKQSHYEEKHFVNKAQVKKDHFKNKEEINEKVKSHDEKSGDLVEDSEEEVENQDEPQLDKNHNKIEELSISEINSQVLNNYYFFTQLRKAVLTFAFAMIIMAFYVGSYFVSRNIFINFATSFDLIDTFYNRVPCISNSFFQVQKQILTNRLYFDEKGTTYAQDAIEQCTQAETNYRNMIQKKENVYKDIEDTLALVDSKDACSYYINDNITDSSCNQTLDGFYNLGISQNVQVYLKNLNQQQMQFQEQVLMGLTKNYTAADIELKFFDRILFNQELSYYSVVGKAMRLLQILADDQLISLIDLNFVYIKVLFSIYILLQMVLLTLSVKIVIRKLKVSIIQTQMLLKLIPSEEYMRIKEMHFKSERKREKAI